MERPLLSGAGRRLWPSPGCSPPTPSSPWSVAPVDSVAGASRAASLRRGSRAAWSRSASGAPFSTAQAMWTTRSLATGHLNGDLLGPNMGLRKPSISKTVVESGGW